MVAKSISRHRSETQGEWLDSPSVNPKKRYGFNRGFEAVRNGFRPPAMDALSLGPGGRGGGGAGGAGGAGESTSG